MIFHSSFQSSYLWLPLIGFSVGLLASMVGGGGGFFFPPVLILIFKVPAHIAVATSLAATLPICLVGAVGYYRKGNLDVHTGITFGVAGIIGALAGASVTGLLTPDQLQTSFGIYAILLAFLIIFNNHKDKKKIRTVKKPPPIQMSGIIPRGSFYGFAGGFISGTFGTSGTAPVLTGLFAIKLPIKLVAGTSLTVVFINTVSALTGHLFIGIIDLTLVWFLSAGAVIGAFTGPKLLAGVELEKREGRIRQSFAYLILAFGLIMIIT